MSEATCPHKKGGNYMNTYPTEMIENFSKALLLFANFLDTIDFDDLDEELTLD